MGYGEVKWSEDWSTGRQKISTDFGDFFVEKTFSFILSVKSALLSEKSFR